MPTAQWDAPSATLFVIAVIATSNTEDKGKETSFCLVKLESDLRGYRALRL